MTRKEMLKANKSIKRMINKINNTKDEDYKKNLKKGIKNLWIKCGVNKDIMKQVVKCFIEGFMSREDVNMSKNNEENNDQKNNENNNKQTSIEQQLNEIKKLLAINKNLKDENKPQDKTQVIPVPAAKPKEESEIIINRMYRNLWIIYRGKN